MSPCKSCFENYWDFKPLDGYITATCKFCGNEVEFRARNKGREKMTHGSLCRKCKKGRIITRSAKKARVYRAYYYCPKCKQIYNSPEFLI